VIARRVSPDLARAAALVAERGGTLGRPMHLLAITSSTNEDAKSAAREGAPHGATWVAEEQEAGRGRQGRTWHSPRGENLLASVLARLACPSARLPPVALLAGLAVRDAVARAATGARVGLKWPNDVLVADAAGWRKVAGVLVEAITVGQRVDAVVIGFGINVHTRDFPPDLAERATSVGLVSQEPPDRAAILADVLASLDRDLHVVVQRGLGLFRTRLEESDLLRGRLVRSDSGDAGVACGIDDEGRLLVRREDGILARWSAGEVHLAQTQSQT
jgi:BirA family biotin operon repressor/biotin-[acetyl-CoA-carboxylase] ligase